MRRYTRFSKTTALEIARAYAQPGMSLAAAGLSVGVRHGSSISRWKNLEPEFRTLLRAASLLRALALIEALQKLGKANLRKPPSTDEKQILSWAHDALWHEDPAERAEALGVLHVSIGPRARVPYLDAWFDNGMDQLLAREWEQRS